MKNLTSILYGLILCGLLIFVIKLSIPDEPEGMVLIPAGDDVDAFYMDVYEVTNAQYKAFIDENPQWRKNRALTAIVDDNYLSGWNGNMYPTGKADHPVSERQLVRCESLRGMGWAKNCRQRRSGKERHAAHWRAKNTHGGTLILTIEPTMIVTRREQTFRNPPTKKVGSYAPNYIRFI